MNKCFLESLEELGLTKAQKTAIHDLYRVCFEGPQPLTVPTSVVMNDNIYNAIQKPMGTNCAHSNDVGSYKYPMCKSNTPNSMRDYRKEAKELFKEQVGVKIKKKKCDPHIAGMIKKAQGHLPSRYPVNAVGTSMMPMATGYSTPNRMNYSPYKQGCEATGNGQQ